MIECTKPWISGITSTDSFSSTRLHFPPFMPPFLSMAAFFSTIWTLRLLLAASHFLFLSIFLPPVYPSGNNPSARGGIARLTEKTQSFLFTLSEVIYAVRWRVCPWLKQLDRRRKGRRPETAREEEPRSCLSFYARINTPLMQCNQYIDTDLSSHLFGKLKVSSQEMSL